MKSIFEELNGSVDTPLADVEHQSPLAWDLLWSDPQREEDTVLNNPSDGTNDELSEEENLLQYEMLQRGWSEKDIGFGENTRRATAAVFNKVALDNFLDRFGLAQVVRAHEVQRNGFKVYMDGKLLTVFSAANYCGRPNDSACLLIN